MTIPVSVVMPVYNAERFLREAINSILGQTYTDFEFIIVEDVSTDRTAEIIESYSDARILYIKNKKNIGMPASLNKGIALAHGEYIARMDADDVSIPERIEKQFLFMESHPEVGVTSSNAIIIDGKGNFISEMYVPQSHILILWTFCFSCSIIHPAVMANRQLFRQAGGYRDLANDKAECFPEDYDLWVRLSKQTQFYNFSEPLLKYRMHGKNNSATNMQALLRNSSKICRSYLQSVLGKEIPQTLVDTQWGVANSPSLRGMSQHIERLYNYFINLPGISPQEKKLIREDASIHLLQMVKKYPFDLYSLTTLAHALKINQGAYIYLYVLKKLLYKIRTQSKKY